VPSGAKRGVWRDGLEGVLLLLIGWATLSMGIGLVFVAGGVLLLFLKLPTIDGDLADKQKGEQACRAASSSAHSISACLPQRALNEPVRETAEEFSLLRKGADCYVSLQQISCTVIWYVIWRIQQVL